MYKLFIAEDESTIRNGLMTMIKWEELGVHVCGDAANGVEALERMQHVQPDLLLLDIRMPFMNGLELLKALQDNERCPVAIILTGYNEFDYAQQAIKLGAFDYLVKPCRPSEVRDVVSRAIKMLDTKQDQEQHVHHIQRLWRQGNPIVISHQLGSWLRSPKSPWENRHSIARSINMRIHLDQLQVAVFRNDSKSLQELDYGPTDVELVRYAALNIIEELFATVLAMQAEVIRHHEDIVVLFNPAREDKPEELRNHLERVQSNLQSYLRLSFSIGVSGHLTSIDDIHSSYREALAALDDRFFYGEGGIYVYDETSHNQQHDSTFVLIDSLRRTEVSVLEAVHGYRFQEALEQLDMWFQLLRTNPTLSRSFIQLQAITLATKLIEMMHEQDMDADSDAGRSDGLLALYEALPQLETIDELVGLMSNLLHQLVLGLSRRKPRHRTIEQMTRMIEEQLTDHLSLAQYAERLFVNASYLSSLFKQEMGINFVDYIHQKRIERAKLLLKDQSLKIQEIAYAVGYTDETHFSKTFKKWTGYSPSQFVKSK
ncbi:response regulator [Paenibacillus sp. strain BS8-2]